MMFWMISAAMAGLVTLVLARALWRTGGDVATPEAFDVQVYRDQLAEVDRDVARGVVPAEDATRLRTEISRRILVADAAAEDAQPGTAGPRPAALAVLILALLAVPFGLYTWLGAPGYGDLALADRIAFAEERRENRPNQQSAQDSLPEGLLQVDLSDQDARLLELLRQKVAEAGDDLQGYELLASYEAKAGNFVAALEAQRRVLRLKGEQVTVQDIADYGEFLVLAAGGYVSPEAETVFREVLGRDRENGAARYYIGLMLIQTGRPDQTLRIWDGLLRRGPADAPWIAPIQRQIMAVAPLAGVDYAMPTIGTGNAPGPSAEDIEAASEMTAEERLEMIGGMVAGLADRLANEGGPPQDWARLITSLGVLNERIRAGAIFDNAMEVFADDPAALDMIRRAGQQAGVAE